MWHLRPRPLADPGLAVLVVLGTGTGIATFTASVVSARAFIPGLPVDDPDQVVQLALTRERSPGSFDPVTRAQLVELRSLTDAFESVGGVTLQPVHLTSDGVPPVRARAGFVHGDVFRTLQVEPVVGRVLGRRDGAPDADPVVVLGHGLWQDHLGSDPEVLGRRVEISGRPATVVGVMPPGFRFPFREELWLPLRGESGEPLTGIARTRDGVSLDALRSELAGLAAGLRDGGAADPGPGATFSARRWVEMRRDGSAEALAMPPVVAGSILVLLVAAANVALLFLVRALRTSQATAVRMALGAGRGTVVAERLVETLVLTGVGGLLAVALILGWTAAVRSASAGLLEYGVDFAVEWPVLAATAGGIVLAALVAGLLPALRGTDLELARTLREGPAAGGSYRTGRAAGALLVLEVAFTCVALVGLGHSVRGLRATLRSALDDPPLPVERTLVARYELLGSRHPERAERAGVYRRVVETLESDPAVEAAATGDALPGVVPGFGARPGRVEIETGDGSATTATTYVAAVSPDFFVHLGGRVLRGTDQGWGDRPAAEPVAVVNESFALRWFPGRDAVGARVAVEPGAWRRVVGVVSDVATERADGRADALYLPLSHPGAPIWLMVTVRGDPMAAVPTLREAIAREDADAPVWDVATFEGLILDVSGTARLLMTSFASFALAALLLTAVGLHGLLAFAVGRRTREIAVRAALGAGTGALGRGVFGGVAARLVAGVAAGVALAWWLSPLLGFGLLGSDPRDPLLYVAVPAAVIASAVLAALGPLHRVMRFEIAEALRVDG